MHYAYGHSQDPILTPFEFEDIDGQMLGSISVLDFEEADEDDFDFSYGLGKKTKAERQADKDRKKAEAAARKAGRVEDRATRAATKAADKAAKKARKLLPTGQVVDVTPAESAQVDRFLAQARADLATSTAERDKLKAEANKKRAAKGKPLLKGLGGFFGLGGLGDLGDLGVTNLDALLSTTAAPASWLSAPRGYERRKARGRTKAIDLYYELSIHLQGQLTTLIQQIIQIQNEILQLLAELQERDAAPYQPPYADQAPYYPPGQPAPYPEYPYQQYPTPTSPTGPGAYVPPAEGFVEAGAEVLGPEYAGEAGAGAEYSDYGEGVADSGEADYGIPSQEFALPGGDISSEIFSPDVGYEAAEDYGTAVEEPADVGTGGGSWWESIFG
jgi:hypothetical protein